jgi:hypothetical protein
MSAIGFSAAITLLAAGYQFHLQSFGFGEIAQLPDHFCVVLPDQPLTQLALDFLAIIGTEFRTSVQPPLGNTAIANQLAAFE